MKKNIAIVGATGLVGRKMLQVLLERNFPFQSITLLASTRSAGATISVEGLEKPLEVKVLDENSFKGIDIAFFSAGSEVSQKFAPIAAENNCYVVDNSSYWRRDFDVPLVVPEVNPEDITKESKIIANPNCSTIQLMLPLKALDDKFGLDRVVCSTYQSITGAGQKGVNKLREEMDEKTNDDKHPIAYNAIFHDADASSFTMEEEKMFFETHRILKNDALRLAFTCVRLPILGGHCESVNLELKQSFEMKEIVDALYEFPNISILDNIEDEIYPTPITSHDSDQVYVGRIRRDDSVENGVYLWVVADNLRKGAATNAIQIGEILLNII